MKRTVVPIGTIVGTIILMVVAKVLCGGKNKSARTKKLKSELNNITKESLRKQIDSRSSCPSCQYNSRGYPQILAHFKKCSLLSEAEVDKGNELHKILAPTGDGKVNSVPQWAIEDLDTQEHKDVVSCVRDHVQALVPSSKKKK